MTTSEIEALIRKWRQEKDSELEARIYFKDKMTLTKEEFENVQKKLIGDSKNVITQSITDFWNHSFRWSSREPEILQKKELIDRMDQDLAETSGFRVNLKTEKKVQANRPQKAKLVRVKHRSTLHIPYIEYSFTKIASSTDEKVAHSLAKEENFTSYEIEVELDRQILSTGKTDKECAILFLEAILRAF